MAIRTKGRNAVAQQQTIQAARIPAPTKGMDARSAVGAMSPDNCIYTYNLIPAEYGLHLRNGFREWQIDVISATSYGIKTLMVFDGIITSLTDDRLFAVTNEGIWDVTVEGGTPSLEIAFTRDVTEAAGHGVYAHYIEESGAQFVLYADSRNGLYEYDISLDTWAEATGITGPDLTKVAYVVVHKQRLWLIEDGATSAWYLPIASRKGTAIEFFFGSKFPHGGKLVSLINWSVDGGSGLDDYLVAVSSSGDVIPYQGADPSSVEDSTSSGWAVRGSYYIGRIPAGRRFFSEYSGELYILSAFGIISMSDLLNGVDSKSTSATSLAYPIARLLRDRLDLTSEIRGWEITFLPSQGDLMVLSPKHVLTGADIQYTMSLSVEGWGLWRGVPMDCVTEWSGKTYFGTADGRICVMDVHKDNVLLDTASPDQGGVPVEYSLLTSYTDLGSQGQFKKAQLVRPDFLANSIPSFSAKVFYDYDITEKIFNVDHTIYTDNDKWDISSWDAAVWGSTDLEGYNTVQGQLGVGRTLAIALRGDSSERTRLVSFDLSWTVGGIL